MTLTAYAGVTRPKFIPVGATAQPGYGQQTIAATTTPTISSSGSMNVILAGDYMIAVIGLPDITTTVSSVTVVGSSGLTFTRLYRDVLSSTATEVWVSNASPSLQAGCTGVQFTLSASVVTNAEAYQITGASSAPFLIAHATSTSATKVATAAGPNTQQTLLALTLRYNYTSTGVYRPTSLRAGAFTNPIVGDNSIGYFDGAGLTPQVADSSSTAGPFSFSIIGIAGPVITMDDLNYQLRDDGPLLNNFTGSPTFDVESITGLDDSTTAATTEQIDGADGSYVTAKFLQGKTISIKGTIYAPLPVDEGVMDNLKRASRPASSNDIGVPFYYKLVNQPLRALMVKPLSLISEINPDRTIGKIPYEIIIASQDVRSFSPVVALAQDTSSSLVFLQQAAVGGNIETYPRIYFCAYDAGLGNYTFSNDVWTALYGTTAQVVVSGSGLPADGTSVYCLDLGQKKLTNIVTGADWSSKIITRNWFGLAPGVTNVIKFVRPAGSSMGAIGFSTSYADAWR